MDDNRRTVLGITIDNPDTRDRDDAIWIEPQSDGGYIVYISIADVAAHIEQDSDVDKEARQRGFSRYFARGTVYMLPRGVTLGTCSLDAGYVRDTVTVVIPMSVDLEVGQPEIVLSSLRSRSQLSYGEADAVAAQEDHPVAEMLRRGFDLSSRLLQRRREKGALAVYDLRNGWYTDEEGEFFRYEGDELHRSHVLIQELMILANRVLAEEAIRLDLPQIFRNHRARNAAPTQQDLATEIQEALSLPGMRSLATLQRRVRLVVGRATYGIELQGHYGLNLAAYAHMTSPIRRYVDLVNWRMWRAHLLGQPMPYSTDELVAIAEEMTGIQEALRPQRREDHSAAQYDVTAAKQVLLERPAGDLHKLLKLRCQDGDLDPQLEEAVLTRVGLGTIRPKSLFYLLEAQGQAFAQVKDAIWQQLDQQPGLAASLWDILNSEKGLHPVFTRHAGEDDRKFWSASVEVDDRALQSPLAGDRSTHRARHKALLWLLRLYYGEEAPVGDIASNKVTQEMDLLLSVSQQPKVEGNPKQELLELCQQRRLAMPAYQTELLGEQHRPIFSTSATLKIGEEEYSGSGLDTLKKRSEQRASRELMVQLQSVVWHELAEESDATDLANYVGMLMELTISEGWPPPTFETQRSGGGDHMPEFTCVARLRTAERMVEQSATASSKQEAKRLAAKAVYQELKAG